MEEGVEGDADVNAATVATAAAALLGPPHPLACLLSATAGCVAAAAVTQPHGAPRGPRAARRDLDTRPQP
jgi:uncharacterized OsmC-like protein